MPVLNITERGHLLPLAPYAVLAALVWPQSKDDSKRVAFVRAHRAQLIVHIERQHHPDVRGMIVDAFAEIYREIPTERRFGIATSGQILQRVWQLAASAPERASVNKAIGDLVAFDARLQVEARKAGERPVRRGYNRSRLMAVWSEWRPSAHLATAFVDWLRDRPLARSRISPLNPTTLVHFLARAELYRQFGEQHVAPHARKFHGPLTKPLLDPAETWRLPPDLILPKIVASELVEI